MKEVISQDYGQILINELGVSESEIPVDKGEFLNLIISEIIRNGMYCLFFSDNGSMEKSEPISTNSLLHFVRKKSSAVLANSGYKQEEIDLKIDILLKTNQKPKENRYDPDFFDMGEILHLGGYKPIYPTQTRVIVSENLQRPILICSWPTKILRENSVDVKINHLTRNISSSDIEKFNIHTQSIESFIAPPRLIVETMDFEDPIERISAIISSLGDGQKFEQWKEEVLRENRKILVIQKEYLRINETQYQEWMKPQGKMPNDPRRYWSILKTESNYGESEFHLFVKGGVGYSEGTVRSIPHGIVRYLLRLFHGSKSIKIKSFDSDYDLILLDGVPPTAGRRMLQLFSCKNETTNDSKKKGQLIYKSPKEYTSIITDYLTKYFIYEFKEGQS